MLGLSAEQWSAIGACASALGSLVAAFALVAAWKGLQHNARALQIQVLEGIFRDIRGLDREFITQFEEMSPTEKTGWSATFFNTIEYLCFLVEREHVPRDVLQGFFFDTALSDWRKTFNEHLNLNILGDGDEQFTEFKKASSQRR